MTTEKITREQLEEWIEIWKDSSMSYKLPRSWVLQDNINELLGLDRDTFDGNGISTISLDRGILLRLNLEILKLKNENNKKIS